jgi:hypothetical protein
MPAVQVCSVTMKSEAARREPGGFFFGAVIRY